MDVWWPKDAPNCFKKEIVRVMKDTETVNIGIQTEQEVTQDSMTDKNSESQEKVELEKSETKHETKFVEMFVFCSIIMLLSIMYLFWRKM